MERLYLETSSGTVSYLERKGEKPLVFLHGLGGSGNNWLKLAKFIPDKYRLLMPDLKGHGKSTREMDSYSISEQIVFLKDFIELLGLEDYTLIGNSYGGWIAMKYSAKIEKPENLVLIDSAGINPTVGETSEDGVERFVDRVMRMNPRNQRGLIEKLARKNAEGDEKLTAEELISLPSRTLIVWGKKDRLIPLQYGEELNREIKGSTLCILDEGGHIPHSTDSEEVARELIAFLHRIDS